uniref:Polyprotein allergen nematode domain-containing protein n=1 Tax=Plectus sambesii TaxID=2011161 RepID=A0A914WM52_9BILA
MISVKFVLIVLASKVVLTVLNPLLRSEDDVPTRQRRGSGCKDVWRIHRSWLTEDQKEELKTLNYDGADFETLYDKIWSYYVNTKGAVRKEARLKLRDSCLSILKNLIGDENANQLKLLKQQGAKNSEVFASAGQFIEVIDDSEKRQQAEKVVRSCKQVFGSSNKKRRQL